MPVSYPLNDAECSIRFEECTLLMLASPSQGNTLSDYKIITVVLQAPPTEVQTETYSPTQCLTLT